MKPLLGSSGTRLQESRLQLAGERHRVWSEAILGQIMLFAPPPPATQLYSVLYDRLGWLLVGPRSIFGCHGHSCISLYRSEYVGMRPAGGGDGCDAGAGDSCPVTARAGPWPDPPPTPELLLFN